MTSVTEELEKRVLKISDRGTCVAHPQTSSLDSVQIGDIILLKEDSQGKLDEGRIEPSDKEGYRNVEYVVEQAHHNSYVYIGSPDCVNVITARRLDPGRVYDSQERLVEFRDKRSWENQIVIHSVPIIGTMKRTVTFSGFMEPREGDKERNKLH